MKIKCSRCTGSGTEALQEHLQETYLYLIDHPGSTTADIRQAIAPQLRGGAINNRLTELEKFKFIRRSGFASDNKTVLWEAIVPAPEPLEVDREGPVLKAVFRRLKAKWHAERTLALGRSDSPKIGTSEYAKMRGLLGDSALRELLQLFHVHSMKGAGAAMMCACGAGCGSTEVCSEYAHLHSALDFVRHALEEVGYEWNYVVGHGAAVQYMLRVNMEQRDRAEAQNARDACEITELQSLIWEIWFRMRGYEIQVEDLTAYRCERCFGRFPSTPYGHELEKSPICASCSSAEASFRLLQEEREKVAQMKRDQAEAEAMWKGEIERLQTAYAQLADGEKMLEEAKGG